MSSKSIEIEIIDTELETVTTGGGIVTTHSNNTWDNMFSGSPLNQSNIGQAGCSLTQNYMSFNRGGANGTPLSTIWTPCSFALGTAYGANGGFCSIFYRDTPIPSSSGGQVTFHGTNTIPPSTNIVENGDFNSNGFITAVSTYSTDAVGTAIIAGNISQQQSGASKWRSARTVCTGGITALNSHPNINASAAVCQLYQGAYACSPLGGTLASSGIYQTIQGLTAGVGYRLEIKLDQQDTLGAGIFKFGTHELDNGVNINGAVYSNLGGDNSLIYGNTGAGEWANSTILPQSTSTQYIDFVSVGGNEVLSIEYRGYVYGAVNQGSNISLDLIRITELPPAPYNISTIYSIADVKNTPTGTVPLFGRVDIDVTAANLNEDVITIGEALYPLVNTTGLQTLMTAPAGGIRFSNNPAWNPTHPLTIGLNSAVIQLNQTDSVAPFTDSDRYIDCTVISESGLDVKISSLDVVYQSVSTSTTTQVINEDKSLYGKLEVSNSQDFPLNISYNISDGKDLESRFGDYSQTFDIPATAKNNSILNNVWKSTVDQVDKQTFGTKNCRVLVDGLPFFEGTMQIKSAVQKSNPESYSCTLYGGNFSWMSLLKDKFLCEVFGADEEFLYTYQEIESTWLKNSSNSDIQYPLISYKDFNVGGIPNYVNTYNEDQLPDLQPAYYVKNMLKRIFNGIGYTIDSSFIETDHFSRLLNTFPFLSNSAVDDGIHYSSMQSREMSDWQTIETTGLGSLTTNWTTVILNKNEGDNSNSYDNATGVWTCQKAGQYSVNAQCGFRMYLTSDAASECTRYISGSCDWEWNSSNPSDAWGYASRVKATTSSGSSYLGTTSSGWGSPTLRPLDWGQVGCWDTPNSNLIIPPDSVVLGVGDTIELQARFIGQNLTGCDPQVETMIGNSSGAASYGNILPQMSITFDDTSPKLGGNVPYNNILPCGVSQTDYIKSISQLFNLYFTTDVQSKTVYIEPFNKFFKPKESSSDWNMKVDLSKDIVDDYDIGLKRELTVGYKEDNSDVFQKEQNFKSNIYGKTTKLYSYNENLGDNYESGKVDIINPIFSSSTQVWDNDAHDDSTTSKAPVLIPNLWNEDCYSGIGLGNNQWRPSEIIGSFVPRIFYYCWENSVSYTTIPSGLVANSGGTQTYWSRIFSNGNAYQNQTTYPRATFVDWEERLHSATQRPSLSFNDELFTAPGQTNVNAVPGLYTIYYKNMIEQLKQAPRIRNVYINLKISDILNLDLRELVYLDESWWRINRISEFSPANNESTKVELIQWLEVGHYPVYLNTDIIDYT
jgi:hypothetical protein